MEVERTIARVVGIVLLAAAMLYGGVPVFTPSGDTYCGRLFAPMLPLYNCRAVMIPRYVGTGIVIVAGLLLIAIGGRHPRNDAKNDKRPS